MLGSTIRGGFALALALLCCTFAAASAVAADPYEFDPTLSLTGDCSTTALDPVPDPSCPEQPPSGRFENPTSVAIDYYGNEYVGVDAEGPDARIDIYDDEGNFLYELPISQGVKSLAVDEAGNLYVVEQAPGTNTDLVRYTPSKYEPLTGNIEYANPRVVIDSSAATGNAGVAVDRDTQHLFVGWWSTSIREYGSAAEDNALLDTITHEKFLYALWVAVDAEARRLFVSTCKSVEECGVLVFDADAPHDLLEEFWGENVPAGQFFSKQGWLPIAVNEENGHFFIADIALTPQRVYEFGENYEYLSTITNSQFQGASTEAHQIALSNSPLNPDAANRHYLFIPIPVPSGRVLAFNPPDVQPPDVEATAVTSVGETEAEVRATIDPNGAETTYVVEYVSEDQFDEEAFANPRIAVEGTISAQEQATQVVALLEGLSPGTEYRFRIRASNEKGDADPVGEGSFRTYADASVSQTCSNQSLRIGASLALPDCRAYELVTPADTNGRRPGGVGGGGGSFATLQASPLGNALSFLTAGGSLPGTEGTGGFNGDLYRSSRGSAGWSTIRTGPTGTETSNPLPGSPSPDQGYAFWSASGLGSAVVGGKTTQYVRYPDGRAELVGRGSLATDPRAAGVLITEGGAHIVFQTQKGDGGQVPQQLELDAPPTGTEAVYDRTADEVTHVVSLLPGDVTPEPGEDARYVGASPDGAGIAFSIDENLYLRVDNSVTYDLGENLTFAGVTEGGRRIFYVRGGNLFAVDTESGEEIPFTATGNAKVVNVAPDGSRAYFVSTSVIAGSGENPNGAKAKSGKQNLYLSEEGQIRFVGTVTVRDVEGEINSLNDRVDGLGLWTDALPFTPAKDPSRVSRDGSVLLFQSRANLDGYDPGGSTQIYRYDSAGDRLHCVSCIPTGLPATGGASLETYAGSQITKVPFSAYGFVPNLRHDGRRAFFQSKEALVATDTDEVQDVYEWEEQGVGTCDRAGGCLYLISSGTSPDDNYLFGISRSGDDVFFITEDVLVTGDDDTASIYDARVGGGFPPPQESDCEGEGCRPAMTPPPALNPPATPAAGNDNVKPRRKCPKGKRKVIRNGKTRCVKKHKHRRRGHRRAGTTGRAGG